MVFCLVLFSLDSWKWFLAYWFLCLIWFWVSFYGRFDLDVRSTWYHGIIRTQRRYTMTYGNLLSWTGVVGQLSIGRCNSVIKELKTIALICDISYLYFDILKTFQWDWRVGSRGRAVLGTCQPWQESGKCGLATRPERSLGHPGRWTSVQFRKPWTFASMQPRLIEHERLTYVRKCAPASQRQQRAQGTYFVLWLKHKWNLTAQTFQAFFSNLYTLSTLKATGQQATC